MNSEKNREVNKVCGKLNTTNSPVSIFKSKEGRQRILDQYNKLLSAFDFEFRERYVDTIYGPTYVLESGPNDLPQLILFHGSTSNSAAWFADIKELTKNFHVFAVDLIGDAGHSAEMRLNMKNDEYAMWIGDVFEGLGIARASIMGNSLGGWLCLKFASVFPEKVERLVLLAASGIAPIRASFVFRVILYSLRGGKGGEAITRMVYGKDHIPQEVIDYINIISENYRPYTGEVPVIPDPDMVRLTMPVLYIAGEDDQLTNVPKCAKRLRKLLPQPTIYVLKNTGHVIYNVLDKIIPFLRGEG
jgi:pimeloyl-ACP methyl ester carboxylesterase